MATSNLFSRLKKCLFTPPPPRPFRRQPTALALETLENRVLLSGAPLLAATSPQLVPNLYQTILGRSAAPSEETA